MKVKLWNDNRYDFKQTWRDNTYFIKAHDYIELDEDEADQFAGVIYPFTKGDGGIQDPKDYKMLRIERPAKVNLKASLFCQACGFEAASPDDLNAHIKANAGDGKHSLHPDAMNLDAKDILKMITENPNLVASLKEALGMEDKKAGRPRKEAP